MRDPETPLFTYLGLDKNKVYYLASPYSHINKDRMNARYEAIEFIAALLIHEGIILIEPIAMCHHKSIKYELESGYEYWKSRDRTFIERSDGIILTRMEGWEESKGMEDEAGYAYLLNKDIIYLDEWDFTEDEVEVIMDIYQNNKLIEDI